MEKGIEKSNKNTYPIPCMFCNTCYPVWEKIDPYCLYENQHFPIDNPPYIYNELINHSNKKHNKILFVRGNHENTGDSVALCALCFRLYIQKLDPCMWRKQHYALVFPDGTQKEFVDWRWSRCVLSPNEYVKWKNALRLCTDPELRCIPCKCESFIFTSRVNIETNHIIECCSTCHCRVCVTCGMGFDSSHAQIKNLKTCPLCTFAPQVSTKMERYLVGNRESLLKWDAPPVEELQSPICPYNRYIRIHPKDQTPKMKFSVNSLAPMLRSRSSLHIATYAYRTDLVPLHAVLYHILCIAASPQSEPRCPISDVPIRKEGACNALLRYGITTCNVCQAVSTPGDPLPELHWMTCPRWDEDELESAQTHGHFTDRIVLRKRWAIWSALRSIPRKLRDSVFSHLIQDSPYQLCMYAGCDNYPYFSKNWCNLRTKMWPAYHPLLPSKDVIHRTYQLEEHLKRR